MSKKVFTDYYMAEEERLKSYTVTNVCLALMQRIPGC